jgi:hypothetical protein
MGFLEAILSYPVILYTILLGVVLVYWALAMIGLVDFESGGPDLDLDAGLETDLDAGGALEAGEAHSHTLDHEPANVSTLASYLVAMGLGGVPFSVVVSLLTLFSWTISAAAALWILPYVPTSVLRFIVGSGVLVGAFLLSLPPSAIIVRPLRKLFVAHTAISNATLVGQECVVLTGAVDEKFGRAEVPARGAGYHIRVIAETPNTLKRGDTAFIVEYNEAARLYRIQAKVGI